MDRARLEERVGTRIRERQRQTIKRAGSHDRISYIEKRENIASGGANCVVKYWMKEKG